MSTFAYRTRLFALACAALITLNGCAKMFPERYRFKMTVEVDTPQGLRSGSSVYEVWASNTTALLPDARKRDWGVSGESVAVDLPNGRTLFTTLTTRSDHGDLAGLSMTALDPAYRNDVVESAERIASGEGVHPTAEVARNDYPTLVTFRDAASPSTVQEVNPATLHDVFGPGYSLRRIVVQITTEEVTTGIGNRLPWITAYRSKTFAGNRYAVSNTIADSLGAGSFSTELFD